MDSNMGNSTEAQPEENPYRLTKGERGWSGSGEHFGVQDNVIDVEHSDASPNNEPSENQRRRTVNEDGDFSEHVLLRPGDNHYRRWMDTIGPYLGDWVLGKGFYGMFVVQLPQFSGLY